MRFSLTGPDFISRIFVENDDMSKFEKLQKKVADYALELETWGHGAAKCYGVREANTGKYLETFKAAAQVEAFLNSRLNIH